MKKCYDEVMLGLRKIVFYIFLLIYLILCPLMVARMLGFVISPLTHRLVETGLVYVSTNPPDATVTIDGRMAHQKTPTVIRDLTPGKHFIRIELSGYNDWERNVPIVGKKATVLANILLIPEEWPIKRISNQPYQNIFIAADDTLVATNPVLKNIDICRTSQGIAKTLFSPNSPYADGILVRLFNAPQSPFILLEATIKDKPKFLWVNLKENPPVIKEVNREKAVLLRNIARLPESLGPQPAYNAQERFLINGANDLLIRQGARIRLYPQENFGGPPMYDIAKSRPSTNMYFEEKNGELFYLDDDSDFLFAARILPYRTILNIPIPEALRIKISNKEPNAL